MFEFDWKQEKNYLKKNGLVPIGGRGAKFQSIQKTLFKKKTLEKTLEKILLVIGRSLCS